jgi:predicted MFS family arabinose efflux permease
MDELSGSKSKFPIRAVTGGLLAMFLAFGVGRFAYTPLLPLMQEQAGLAVDMAGYLASMMYLGYLSGSIIVTKTLAKFGPSKMLNCGLVLLVLTSWAMSSGEVFGYWAFIMFGIGFSSAMVFLATLSLILGVFLDYGAGWLTASLYSGIGLAIVFIGLVVPEIDKFYGWQGAWIFVALTALFAGGACHFLLKPYNHKLQKSLSTDVAWTSPGAKRAVSFLIASYCLHGFSYTIGGTFMVAMLSEFPGLHGHAHIGWILVGAMVIPSCLIWPVIASRLGETKTVTLLLTLQALANIIVIIWATQTGILVGAAVFGSTFLAIPGLVLGRIAKLAGIKKDQIIGLATILFGIAMVLGPSVGGIIAKLTGSFDRSLIMASIALFIGSGICMLAESPKSMEKCSSHARGEA